MRDPDTDQGGSVPSDMTYKEWKEIYVDKTSTMEDWQAKHVDFSDESGIIISGGVTGALDPDCIEASVHADRY